MNDSFLEDLELVSAAKQPSQPIDRHVTTRTATSSPLQNLGQTRLENLQQKSDRQSPRGSPTISESKSKDSQPKKSPESRKQTVRIRVSERKDRNVENKLRPVENRVRIEQKDEQKVDPKKITDKIAQKDRNRRSVSRKENLLSSDLSPRENRPSDSSGESKSPSEPLKDSGKKCDCTRKSTAKEDDPVALLNAIKKLISTYTKQESTRILRAMQELHLNSQANLIKNFITQTDDLVKEMHPSKDSMRVKSLIEQNQRLQEDIGILQKRNEELRKKLEDFELLKEENVSLKLKCKELSK